MEDIRRIIKTCSDQKQQQHKSINALSIIISFSSSHNFVQSKNKKIKS